MAAFAQAALPWIGAAIALAVACFILGRHSNEN